MAPSYPPAGGGGGACLRQGSLVIRLGLLYHFFQHCFCYRNRSIFWFGTHGSPTGGPRADPPSRSAPGCSGLSALSSHTAACFSLPISDSILLHCPPAPRKSHQLLECSGGRRDGCGRHGSSVPWRPDAGHHTAPGHVDKEPPRGILQC